MILKQVKIIRRSRYLLLGAALLATASVKAETPEKALYTVFAKLKSSKDVSPLVEIVDWKSLYSQMPDGEKKLSKLSSAEDLKNKYHKQAVDNGAGSVDMLKGVVSDKTLSSSEKDIGRNTLGTVQKQLENIRSSTQKALAQTKFIIENVKLEGDDKAQVFLKKLYQKEESQITLSMQKTEQGWLTNNAGPLNPLGSGGSPIGSFPNPMSSLSKR